MPYTSIWTRKLQNSVNNIIPAKGVFVGYNACIDFIEYLDGQHLEEVFKEELTVDLATKLFTSDYPSRIETKEDFLNSLVKSISKGKAKEIPTYNSPQMNVWFNKVFAEADEHRMGGQSGIIANLLAKLGVSTIVYIPNLNHVQARRFNNNVLFPVKDPYLGQFTLRKITKCGQEEAITKINWIFEYEEDLHFPIQGHHELIKAPRSNRLIIADRPKGLVPGFSDELESYLPELGTLVDRAILSGYQYLSQDNVTERMNREQEFLKKFVSRNPNLRLHLEYASISNVFVRKTILDKLKPYIHSLGFNEVELRSILHDLGELELESALEQDESITLIYEAMNRVKELLSIPRIHMHTVAYHIMLIDSNYCKNVSIESVQNAVLYSSLIGTAKTLVGEFSSRNIKDFEIKLANQLPVSYTGIKSLETLAIKLKEKGTITDVHNFLSTGIIKENNIWKLIVPVQLTPPDQIKSTVGLGDSISSTAFTFDCKN